jgi:hypothetical protein
MREKIEQRVDSLRAEYQAGQKMLAEMEGRQTSLKFTLTRISGAIQVLEELLQGNNADTEQTKPAESAASSVSV